MAGAVPVGFAGGVGGRRGSAGLVAGRLSRRSWRIVARRVGAVQAGGGSARSPGERCEEVLAQGQRAGIRSVERRAVRVSRPGMVSSRRRRVRAVGTVVSGSPISLVQRSRLCASAAITVQAALAANCAGWEVRERLVFEVADREFDDGVLAVLGLDEFERSVRLVRNAK